MPSVDDLNFKYPFSQEARFKFSSLLREEISALQGPMKLYVSITAKHLRPILYFNNMSLIFGPLQSGMSQEEDLASDEIAIH